MIKAEKTTWWPVELSLVGNCVRNVNYKITFYTKYKSSYFRVSYWLNLHYVECREIRLFPVRSSERALANMS